MNGVILAVTTALLMSACWTDLRWLRIPNGLTVGFASAGLGFHVLDAGWSGVGLAFGGAAAGILPLLVLYRLRGMGGGDVKWFGAFGMWTGAVTTLQLLCCSILFAGGISIILLMLRIPGLRRLGERMPWPWGDHPAYAGKKATFPFMLAVVPGFMWMVSFGAFQVGWEVP